MQPKQLKIYFNFQAGNCKFGEDCKFAHSEASAFARGKGPFIASKVLTYIQII